MTVVAPPVDPQGALLDAQIAAVQALLASTIKTGANFLTVPGTAGNYASTPNAAVNQITGDIDFIAYVSATNWSTGSNQAIIGKFLPAAQKAYTLEIGTTGKLHLATSPDGSATVIAGDSTVAVPFANGTAGWVRATLQVNDGSGNHVYKFYTSSQSPLIGIARLVWNQLGTTVTTAGTTSIFAATSEVDIGMRTGSSGVEPFAGSIYSVYMFQGISGTLALSFNANDAAVNAASWVSSGTAEVWTINGTAAIAGNFVLVNANPSQIYQNQQRLNMLQVEAVDHYMVTGWLNAATILLTYTPPPWDKVGQTISQRVSFLTTLLANAIAAGMPPGNADGYGAGGLVTVAQNFAQKLYAKQIELVEHIMDLPGGTSAATMLANLTGVQTAPAGITFQYVFSSVGFTDAWIDD